MPYINDWEERMSKLIKVGEFYYEVEREEGDSYVCFPLGGGFQHRIPKTAADPCAYEMSWAPAQVVFHESGSGWFTCMLDHNYRWNGWRDPYFEKGEMLRFLKSEGFTIKSETEHCIQFYYVDENDDNGCHEADKCEIEGTEYWNISGWCFVSKEESGETEQAAV